MFETIASYLIISNMKVNCSQLLVLNRTMWFRQNMCSLTDGLVLKQKILYLTDLSKRIYINHVNIEDNSH